MIKLGDLLKLEEGLIRTVPIPISSVLNHFSYFNPFPQINLRADDDKIIANISNPISIKEYNKFLALINNYGYFPSSYRIIKNNELQNFRKYIEYNVL